VSDAAGAWRFIDLFVAHYATPLVAGSGYHDDELRQAETRLGLSLPTSMRALYALLGRRPDLTAAHQGCTRWGIPLSVAGEPDPPVVFSDVGWHPFLDRFSLACVELACVEMVLSEWILGGAKHGIHCEPEGETIALMGQRLRRRPLPDYPAWWQFTGGPVRWFEQSGAILLEHPGPWLWAGAASPDAIAALRRALPADWSNSL
jgi:hypothetical protein